MFHLYTQLNVKNTKNQFYLRVGLLFKPVSAGTYLQALDPQVPAHK